jgi:CxxC motif-containing protein (DUF1111 family)
MRLEKPVFNWYMRLNLKPQSFLYPSLFTLFLGAITLAQPPRPPAPPPPPPPPAGVNDPGPRTGSNNTGQPFASLQSADLAAFNAGKETFLEVDTVPTGLGPRFNGDSCAACHAQPVTGGSSPSVNPQIAMASRNGAQNQIPPFITPNGPVRVARLRLNPDGTAAGGVINLFTIAGRADAPGCDATQPNFGQLAQANNLSFRIPTPLFGSGLIEAIPDATLLANLAANSTVKSGLGITGHFNTNGNDGTITRYGWKAQNKSLVVFAGEAYNVEQGVTNELFPNERENISGCMYNATPEDFTHAGAATASASWSDIVNFVNFIRNLAPPVPAAATSSTANGAALFGQVGCAACHTPSLTTGASTSTVVSNQHAALYSDLALHAMGQALNDGITQGNAGPGDWRTAPLWGVGQRLFFLHDGRASNLLDAISAHASQGSEANAVIANYNALTASQKQDLINFLRSL